MDYLGASISDGCSRSHGYYQYSSSYWSDRQDSLFGKYDCGEFATLLDPDVAEDFIPENIRPKHLVFISKTWFYILSKTLLPLSNAHEESNLHPAIRHAIFKLSHGTVFDFEDCFLKTMVSFAELSFQYKPYAP